MTTTDKPRSLVGITVLSMLAAGGIIAGLGKIQEEMKPDPNDRIVTLATAWGTGVAASGSAYMQWFTTSHGSDHQIHGGGHWEKIIHAKRGDQVTLIGTASNADPLSCSISTTRTSTHGGARCEILHLP